MYKRMVLVILAIVMALGNLVPALPTPDDCVSPQNPICGG